MLEKLYKLAERQGALGKRILVSGKPVGTVADYCRGSAKGDPEALRKLDALYRLGFNFRHIDAVDLSSFQVPEAVASTELVGRGTLSAGRNELTLLYYHTPSEGQEDLLARITLVYRPEARALSLFTCQDIAIDRTKKVSYEVIARAFITASKVFAQLKKDVALACAYYSLDEDDYVPGSGQLRPEVEERIGRTFGALAGIGFIRDMPSGIVERMFSPQGKIITIEELERNYEASWWNWCYEKRFGEEFTRLLDREEITRRIKERDAEEWQIPA